MSKIKIKQVLIKNFRGYKGEYTFDFDPNKRFVFISGVNGLGKTSLFDAIEWGLTGNIRRILRDIIERDDSVTISTQSGYIKNLGSLNEETFVKIVFFLNDCEFAFKRTIGIGLQEINNFTNKKIISLQKGTPEISLPEDCDITELNLFEKTLKELQNSEIFDKYLCSYDKNIRLYSSNKKEIANLIYGYLYDVKKADDNLISLNNLKTIVDTKNTELTSEEDFYITANKELETKIYELKPQDIIPESYQNKIYNGEKNISELISVENKEEQIDCQTKKLDEIKAFLNSFYNYHNANDYLANLEILKNSSWFPTVKTAYYQSKDLLTFFDIKITEFDKIKEKRILIKNIKEGLQEAKDIDYENLLSKIVNSENSTIKDIQLNLKKCLQLIKEINELTLPEAQSSIDALKTNINSLKEFQKTKYAEKCPLCKSDEFKTADIEKNINDLLTIFGEISQKKLKKRTDLNEIIIFLSDLFSSTIEKDLNKLEEYIKKLHEEISIKQNVNFVLSDENIENKETERNNAQNKINDFENKFICLSDDDNFGRIWGIDRSETPESKYVSVKRKIEAYKNLLTIYQENEYLDEFYKNISNPDYTFSDDFQTIKLGAKIKHQIESIDIKNKILNNLKIRTINAKELKERSEKLEQNKKKLEKIEKQKPLVQDYKIAITELISKIDTLKTETDTNIGKTLGKTVEKVFNRINRHTNFKIQTNPGGRTESSFEILCIDEETGEKVNSPIVMSTGQVSTVALSVFWAIINAKKQNNFRCYFLDDPIQSIDDLNILSFIDLLRAELQDEEDNIFDQMFFATCDSGLESLIIHKMKTFGIDFDFIKFSNYAEFKKIQ